MQLSPQINIDLGHPVWRMEIDDDADVLCLEIRSTENKTTSFSGIALNTGNVNFRELTLPHGWHCGLGAAGNGLMLVHGFRSELLPVRKGLTAINTTTGKTLWVDYNLNLENIYNGIFEVYDARFEVKRPFFIEAATGKKLDQTVHSPLKTEIFYPDVLDEEAVTETGLATVLHAGTALFLKHNTYRILSLHAISESAVNQYLRVFNAAGEIVLEDIVALDIQKLQPEAFIVFKDKLIWLQNRSIVKVLHL